MNSLEADLEKNIPDFFRNAHGKDHLPSRAEASGFGLVFQRLLYDLHKRKIFLAIVVLAFTGLSSPSFSESDDLMVSESQILKNQLDKPSIDNDPRRKPQRELYHFPKTRPSSMLRQAHNSRPQNQLVEEQQSIDQIPQDEVPLDSLQLGNATETSESEHSTLQLQPGKGPWIIPKNDDAADGEEGTPSMAEDQEGERGPSSSSPIVPSAGEPPAGSSLEASPELQDIPREVEPVSFQADQKYYNVELYIHCDKNDDEQQQLQNIGYTIYDMRQNQVLSQKQSLVDAEKVYVLPIPTGQYMVEVTDREGSGHGRYELWVNKVKLAEGSDFKHTSGVMEFKLFSNGNRKLVSHKKTQ